MRSRPLSSARAARARRARQNSHSRPAAPAMMPSDPRRTAVPSPKNIGKITSGGTSATASAPSAAICANADIIAPGGALTLLGSTPVSGTSVGAVDARLSPGGRLLFVDESKTGAVAAFAVNGASLTELASSPTSLPAGAAPAGIVVT